ncbi:MAG: Rhs element Vgr protein, partial [Sinomicrobium sp.]|nr:Rhs element Vgr protein [Sinomicrobium sp.]
SEVMNVSNYALQSTVPLVKDALKQWADAQLLKSRINRFQGTVSFQGNALPKPDTVITITGLGDRMNGNAYITSVRHDIDSGNWTTEVGFGISEKWYTEEMEASPPKAAGVMPGVNGLQLGVVKQIDQDPENEYRVLVTLPLITSGDTGVWARLSTFYASKQFGAFFYPEVGDEVVLGFLDDNPTYPVILGSLYSKVRTPALTPDDKNSKKSVLTSSKLELTFDDENKIITILTPGGNSITLSDKDKSINIKDQNGNKADFTNSGITISSASALTLKASQGVSIEGGTTVSIKASTSLDAQGSTGVTVKSDTTLSLQGQASAELKASGTVTVQGAMVSLN